MWLNNLPGVTVAEISVVAVAAAFLMITPLAFVWADAVRRRRAAPALATTTLSPSASEQLLTIDPPLEPPAPGDVSSAESPWPTEAPAASSDLIGAIGTDPYDVETVLSVDPAAPVDASIGAGDSAEKSPEVAAPSVPDAIEVEEINVPLVYRGQLLDLEPPVPSGKPFQLLELRQARLSNWPPETVSSDAEQRNLWEEGERLVGRHDRQISSANLAWPRVLQSAIYAGLATDGGLHRVRFLLFEDMWPAAADQATAEAIFEVDDRGVRRAWIEAR